MLAGGAVVNITPHEGIQLSGNVGRFRPARVFADPLYARAVVVESKGKKICFVCLDLCVITKQYSDMIRKEASKRFGFDFDAVMVHSLQIHSAPSLGNFLLTDGLKDIPQELKWLGGGADESYCQFVVEKTTEAIKIANESLEVVQIGTGRGIEGRMASNRRAVMRNGKVKMPWIWNPLNVPAGFTDILFMEGPMDPEVGVVCFRKDSLELPVILVNYTCHPVIVYGKDPGGNIVSADWPGALSYYLRETYGKNTIPVVLNGACGNINPWNPFDPYYVPDHRKIGRILGKMVES